MITFPTIYLVLTLCVWKFFLHVGATHVCLVPMEAIEILDSPELALEMVVSCFVGSQNQARVFVFVKQTLHRLRHPSNSGFLAFLLCPVKKNGLL